MLATLTATVDQSLTGASLTIMLTVPSAPPVGVALLALVLPPHPTTRGIAAKRIAVVHNDIAFDIVEFIAVLLIFLSVAICGDLRELVWLPFASISVDLDPTFYEFGPRATNAQGFLSEASCGGMGHSADSRPTQPRDQTKEATATKSGHTPTFAFVLFP
jgi:hypothetical protein